MKARDRFFYNSFMIYFTNRLGCVRYEFPELEDLCLCLDSDEDNGPRSTFKTKPVQVQPGICTYKKNKK